MTVKELLSQAAVKERLSDSLETGYDTAELVAYLNDAMDFIWHVLIQQKYHEVIGDITLTTEQTDVPSDFYQFTNQAPVVVRNGKLECYGELPQTLRYFRKFPMIKDENSELPIDNWGLLDLATQIMIILAMSNHGFDMQTESDFAQAIINLI